MVCQFTDSLYGKYHHHKTGFEKEKMHSGSYNISGNELNVIHYILISFGQFYNVTLKSKILRILDVHESALL